MKFLGNICSNERERTLVFAKYVLRKQYGKNCVVQSSLQLRAGALQIIVICWSIPLK